MSLKLLHNLSFDPQQRDLLVKNSIIPRLVILLKKPPFRASTLRILYHLSMDDRCKSMFTYTDAIPIVMQLVVCIASPHEFRGVELTLRIVFVDQFPTKYHRQRACGAYCQFESQRTKR